MLTFRERLSLAWRILRARRSGLVEYAEREFDIANRLDREEEFRRVQGDVELPAGRFDDYQTHLRETLLTFSLYGHSGGSAPHAIATLNRLLKFRPLTPLTGAVDEWIDCAPAWVGARQNKRHSTVFEVIEDEGGWPSKVVYDSDGILFRDPDGNVFARPGASDKPIIFPYDVPDEPIIIDVDDGGAPIDQGVSLGKDVAARIADLLQGSDDREAKALAGALNAALTA